MATARSLSIFDEEDHPSDAYGAFCEFVEEFQYECDAVAKDPPRDLDATQAATWVEQHKRKLFIRTYASRNLQKEYEDVVPANKRSAIAFAEVVTRLKTHFLASSNKTLANYMFHKLSQKMGERLDALYESSARLQSVNSSAPMPIVRCQMYW